MRRKPNHDELDRLNTAEEDIRKLKLDLLDSGGFSPTAAAIYDGYLGTDANPGFITWRRDDLTITSGAAIINLSAGHDIPPNLDGSDRPWATYVWYDAAGYVVTPGSFTTPTAGIYLVDIYTTINLSFGFLGEAVLEAQANTAGGTVVISRDVISGPLDATNPDLPTLWLHASGQARLRAGDTITFDFEAHVHGLAGMVSNDVVLTIPRNSRFSPPPTDSLGQPADTTRFSITKIADG